MAPILNEIAVFRLVDGTLHARTVTAEHQATISPDATVRRTLGWAGDETPDGAFLHSTSWRYDAPNDTLILTWAVFPDPDPSAGGYTPVDVFTSTTVNTIRPAARPEDQAAVEHAARHLAFLIAEDPRVLAAAQQHTGLVDALRKHSPSMAGNALDPYRAN